MKKLETVAKKKYVSYLLQEIYVFCIFLYQLFNYTAR